MTTNMKQVAQASVLAMGLALAGCGGGSGGGLASTPTPQPSGAPTPSPSPSPSPSPTPAPTPTPSPTPTPPAYTKTVDMTGNRTFQTAGVRFISNNGVAATFGAAQTFGNGVSVAYTAATDSYKLTAADNSTVTFEPSDVSTSSEPNTLEWTKASGAIRDTLALTVPTVNGVALSYTIIGQWVHFDGGSNQSLNRIAVGGSPTLASDMPRSGTATYSAAMPGVLARSGFAAPLGNSSSATFSADFANNSVTTVLALADALGPSAPFGTFNGTGTIASSGPGFSGTFADGGATGAFSGAFFGPKALEMAYGWYISGTGFNAGGTVVGVKQ